MLSAASTLLNRLAFSETISRRDIATLVTVAGLHLAALVIMAATEVDLVAKIAFLLAWAALNCVWLAALRRPAIAAFMSLAMLVALILFSQFKYDKLMMTVNFVDLMIIDRDTSRFPVHDHAEFALVGHAQRAPCCAADGADLAFRYVPHSPAHNVHRRRMLPGRIGGALDVGSERFF